MRKEFAPHTLNELGIKQTDEIAEAFSACLDRVAAVLSPGRELAIVVTKMQEAKMFACFGISTHAASVAEHVPTGAPTTTETP